MSPLVLVAHGSRDPRAALSTRALARAVGVARPASRVATAFLDFEGPRLPATLAGLAAPGAVVVPLLLTAAYHGRVDVPGEVRRVREAGLAVDLSEVLGPVAGVDVDAAVVALLVAGLSRRLAEVDALAADGFVLAAAGTRQVPALASVDLVAAALGEALDRPCRPGYASGAGPGVGDAVRELRAGGARRIALAGYFLAPGVLYDRAVADAREAGAYAAAAPLGDAPEIVELVLRRADSAAIR
jgi:sirohydrochlorin ferrochelatase